MKITDLIFRLWHSRWIFRSLLYTVYFNFHYFKWKQAIRLPVLLYKPKLLKCRGKLILATNDVQTGMVILGKETVSIYPNQGITWECEGEITFSGKCYIGNASAISVASSGQVSFGKDFYASSALKLVAYNYIAFGDDVHVGWECMIIDTDLHKMKIRETGLPTRGYGGIVLGCRNWFGMKCCVLKNTQTPDDCTVSAGSILNKSYKDIPPYSIIGADCKIVLKREGVYRDLADDKIDYVKFK